MAKQEIDYYCLNCGQKLEERDIKRHMKGHQDEAHGKITYRRLQDR